MGYDGKLKLLVVYPMAINMEVKLTYYDMKVQLHPHFQSTTQARESEIN